MNDRGVSRSGAPLLHMTFRDRALPLSSKDAYTRLYKPDRLRDRLIHIEIARIQQVGVDRLAQAGRYPASRRVRRAP